LRLVFFSVEFCKSLHSEFAFGFNEETIMFMLNLQSEIRCLFMLNEL